MITPVKTLLRPQSDSLYGRTEESWRHDQIFYQIGFQLI